MAVKGAGVYDLEDIRETCFYPGCPRNTVPGFESCRGHMTAGERRELDQPASRRYNRVHTENLP